MSAYIEFALKGEKYRTEDVLQGIASKYDLQDYEVCALQQAELCIALLTNIKNICECVRREEV